MPKYFIDCFTTLVMLTITFARKNNKYKNEFVFPELEIRNQYFSKYFDTCSIILITEE